MTTLVSVVIPSASHPHLVRRAVASVLAQSMTDLECIVVLDGPRPQTEADLSPISDPRLRVLTTPEQRGAAYARNCGIRKASGNFIAFLDDDDEWLPTKLERQLSTYRQFQHSGHPLVVSCQFSVPQQASSIPTQVPSEPVPAAEYLFDRSEIRWTARQLQTSTLFVARKDIIDFDDSLPRHQDWDWIIRMAARGARVTVIPEVLTVWHDHAGPRISRRPLTEESLTWALSIKVTLSKRAYAGLLLAHLGPAAAKSRNWRLALKIVREALSNSAPRLNHFVTLAAAALPRFRRVN
jgi:glycosyltransferase involved in cell wall biosynthesis